MRSLSWRLTLRVIAVLSWIVSIIWFIVEPGFEPLLTFLSGVAAFLGSFAGSDEATLRGATRPKRKEDHLPQWFSVLLAFTVVIMLAVSVLWGQAVVKQPDAVATFWAGLWATQTTEATLDVLTYTPISHTPTCTPAAPRPPTATSTVFTVTLALTSALSSATVPPTPAYTPTPPMPISTDTPVSPPTPTSTHIPVPLPPTRTYTPVSPMPWPPKPTIYSFTADRYVITAGENVVLRWDLADADVVYLCYNGIEEGVVAPGTKTVSPARTTVYTLIARNSVGNTTAQLTITVKSPTPILLPTPTLPPTSTPTSMPTPTLPPTSTPTSTPTPTLPPTPTLTPTATPPPTPCPPTPPNPFPSNTPVLPTLTPTPKPTKSGSPVPTPTSTRGSPWPSGASAPTE